MPNVHKMVKQSCCVTSLEKTSPAEGAVLSTLYIKGLISLIP